MYLETRDVNEMMNIYTTAWKKGVKTTYYLHMKPRHTAEQSTTKVNKGAVIGKRGFGALRSAQSTAPKVPSDTIHTVTSEEDVIGTYASDSQDKL